jgi:hypothetical protein
MGPSLESLSSGELHLVQALKRELAGVVQVGDALQPLPTPGRPAMPSRPQCSSGGARNPQSHPSLTCFCNDWTYVRYLRAR